MLIDAPLDETSQLLARLGKENAGMPDPTLMCPDEGRQLSEWLNRRWNDGLPDVASVRNLVIPPNGDLLTDALPVRVFQPAATLGAILYVHGGGFAFGSLDSHDRAMRTLAVSSRMTVVGVQYHLAPEHPFPAGLHDVVAAWRALWQQALPGLPASPIAISGDSAGANLALAAALHEHRLSRPLPDFLLLFYGVYGADFDTDSYRIYGDGRYGLSRARMERYFDWYLADPQKRSDPLCSPLEAADDTLRAMPPMFLNYAGLDPLLSETLALFDRLQRLGRTADYLHPCPGVPHGFMQMTLELAAARKAFDAVGQWSRRQCAATPPGLS